MGKPKNIVFHAPARTYLRKRDMGQTHVKAHVDKQLQLCRAKYMKAERKLEQTQRQQPGGKEFSAGKEFLQEKFCRGGDV